MGPKDEKTEAEALRIALLSGIVESTDVIAWADGRIAAQPTPHISIIEVALATTESKEHLAFRLADVPGEKKTAAAVRFILSLLLDRLDRGTDPRRVAEQLYLLARTADWPVDEFGTEPYWLDDLFDPESASGRSYDEASADLRAYLAKHTG